MNPSKKDINNYSILTEKYKKIKRKSISDAKEKQVQSIILK